MVMNSPCAMLMTPICPKMMASPRPISSSTENRLRPAKPCIRPMLSISENVMRVLQGPPSFREGGNPRCAAMLDSRLHGNDTAAACLLVSLGEWVRLDQGGRLRDHLELP